MKELTCSEEGCKEKSLYTQANLLDKCIFHMPSIVRNVLLYQDPKKYPAFWKEYKSQITRYLKSVGKQSPKKAN